VSRRVRFDGEADAEYRFAGRWYEARREHLGVEFFDAVDATIDQIVAMPGAGARVRQLPAELTVRRRAVARFPYHVVYLELTSHIRVLAIAHDRRKPGYWKDRLARA
jgi:plasmid stabilization system protein ParE